MTAATGQRTRLLSLVDKFRQTRLLVIGDLILDQFIWGRVDRISPEAPVPVVQVTSESCRLGGAANVVHNIRALGGSVSVCGLIGEDPMGRRLLDELARLEIPLEGVISSSSYQTPHKTRIIAHNQQVVRLDRENSQVKHESATRRIGDFVCRNYKNFDAVVVSDYGKGVVDSGLLAVLHELRQKCGFPCIVDPKQRNFDLYSGVTLITPNEAEAEIASGIRIEDEESLHTCGTRLLGRWSAEAVLVTRGEKGMTLFEKEKPPTHIPTAARQVYDVTGAGDTVLATCSLGLAAGGDFTEVATLANLAAGVVVGEVGTVAVTRAQLRAVLAQ